MKPRLYSSTFSLLIATVVLLPFSIAACQSTPQTPEAAMFATLKAAGAGIDSFRTSYEAAYRNHEISDEQKLEADRRFNKANDAIIAAAQALHDGQNAQTPAEVDQFVRSLADFVTKIVPPKTKRPGMASQFLPQLER